jgi:hypothetical protein
VLTSQLATRLSRKVTWTGTSNGTHEYLVGGTLALRIRVRNNKFTDVEGSPLTVAQIQFVTN